MIILNIFTIMDLQDRVDKFRYEGYVVFVCYTWRRNNIVTLFVWKLVWRLVFRNHTWSTCMVEDVKERDFHIPRRPPPGHSRFHRSPHDTPAPPLAASSLYMRPRDKYLFFHHNYRLLSIAHYPRANLAKVGRTQVRKKGKLTCKPSG